MSSPENPADQTPDPDSERASHSTKGDHIPQVRDVFKNLGVSIRNAFTKFFAGRASKLRAITFGSIGAFLATWGAFYYNNRHAPPSIAISLFCVGGMFGALTAWQVAKNFNWPDLIANICLVIVILVVFALTSLDWYFEYRHLRLKPPHFEITSAPVNQPSPADGSLSVADIQNRRLRTINITNRNDLPLPLHFIIQFPEPILSVRAPEGSFTAPNIEPHPLTIRVATNGPAASTSSWRVEAFATNEPTGLWEVKLAPIPGHTSISIETITTIGPEGGLFAEEIAAFVKNMRTNEMIGLIAGDYQNTNPFVVPFAFSPGSRRINTFPSGTAIPVTNLIVIHQWPGFRIPGNFSSRGCLEFSHWNIDPALSLDTHIDPTGAVASAAVGFFVNPVEPFVLIQTKAGVDINIGKEVDFKIPPK